MTYAAAMSTHAPELEATLRDWLDAKMAGDRDAIVALLSGDEGVSAIGTEGNEWAVGPEAFARLHGDAGAFTGTVEHLDARVEGDAAWATVRAHVQWEAETLTVRVSIVLVREPAGWRVVHTHASGAG